MSAPPEADEFDNQGAGVPEGTSFRDPGSLEVFHEHETRALSEADVRAAVARVVAGEGVALESLGVILADHDTVHALNREWLGHDYRTDVVSFPLSEAPGVVDGEVYVDLDTAAERAAEFGASFQSEALRYVIHGLLHLVGHDDATDEQRAAMRALEDRYLSRDR